MQKEFYFKYKICRASQRLLRHRIYTNTDGVPVFDQIVALHLQSPQRAYLVYEKGTGFGPITDILWAPHPTMSHVEKVDFWTKTVWASVSMWFYRRQWRMWFLVVTSAFLAAGCLFSTRYHVWFGEAYDADAAFTNAQAFGLYWGAISWAVVALLIVGLVFLVTALLGGDWANMMPARMRKGLPTGEHSKRLLAQDENESFDAYLQRGRDVCAGMGDGSYLLLVSYQNQVITLLQKMGDTVFQLQSATIDEFSKGKYNIFPETMTRMQEGVSVLRESYTHYQLFLRAASDHVDQYCALKEAVLLTNKLGKHTGSTVEMATTCLFLLFSFAGFSQNGSEAFDGKVRALVGANVMEMVAEKKFSVYIRPDTDNGSREKAVRLVFISKKVGQTVSETILSSPKADQYGDVPLEVLRFQMGTLVIGQRDTPPATDSEDLDERQTLTQEGGDMEVTSEERYILSDAELDKEEVMGVPLKERIKQDTKIKRELARKGQAYYAYYDNWFGFFLLILVAAFLFFYTLSQSSSTENVYYIWANQWIGKPFAHIQSFSNLIVYALSFTIVMSLFFRGIYWAWRNGTSDLILIVTMILAIFVLAPIISRVTPNIRVVGGKGRNPNGGNNHGFNG